MNLIHSQIFSITIIIVSLLFQVDGSFAPNDVSSLATVKGYLFAGTYSGKIFVSQDSGLHWSDVSYGLCDSSSLRYQKTIECIKVTRDDSIQAMTACGEFASAVPDVHWNQLSADSCIYEYCPQCIANMEYSGRVNEWMIKSFITGPIEWSRDSGKTWTVAVPGCAYCNMSIIRSLYFDTISALAGLYGNYGSMIGYNSNIIVSTDSGRSWRATGLAGIASGISSIMRMGSIAFAGAENGIYASRDNFATWWLLGESSRCSSGTGQTVVVSKKPSSLLKEIRKDGKPFREYTYDSLGRMISVKAYDNDYANESYTYDSLGRLFKRFYAGFEETYQYEADGALLSKTMYYAATAKTWLENYRRGPECAIIGATTFYNDSGDTMGNILYKYDSRGNTIERSEYHQDTMLYYQERRVFDSLVNPLQLSFPFDMVKKGNIVSYYSYAIFMSSLPIQYSSSYQYNDSGLPLSETRVQTNTNDTLHFEYIYDKTTVGIIREPSIRQTRITFLRGASRSAPVVSMSLNAAALTTISLCDLSGRRVAMPLQPTTLPAGNHRLPLSFNENHIPRAGGIYMCVVRVGGVVETFRIPVIR